jgi:hypothetical protein
VWPERLVWPGQRPEPAVGVAAVAVTLTVPVDGQRCEQDKQRNERGQQVRRQLE